MELTQEAELLQNSWKTYLGSSVEKLAFFVFALGIIAATKFCWEKLKRKNLPPGPWGLPVIGALFRLGSDPYLDLTRMADSYGDIFSLKIGSRLVVVLNRHKVIREALLKKAAIFAGRPPLITFRVASGGGSSGIAFVDYSTKQQALRKISMSAIHKYLTSPQMMEGNIQAECKRVLEHFKRHQGKPFDPRNVFKIATSNIILGILFGTNFSYESKELLALLNISDDFKDCMGGGTQMDYMPWLHMFPSANLTRLSRLYKVFVNLINKLFLDNKATYVDQKIRNLADSLIKTRMENKKTPNMENIKYQLSDKDLLWTLMDLFGAAMDTSTASLAFALGYLVKYPIFQTQIQAEIDSVLDKNEPIQMRHMQNLHYLKALVYEIFRITSLLPTSIPHCTTADTTLGGYYIPKGTVIFPNLWSVHHDPSIWKDPHLFNPRRFLDERSRVIDPDSLVGFMPFSIGRRKCPGYQLGILQICMFLAALLQSFSFSQHENEVLDLTPVFGFTMKPSTFHLKVEMRKEV